MSKTATTTRKRVNITLAADTLRLMDRVVPKGDRSNMIDQAVREYLSTRGKAALRRQLKAGAEVRAERDLGIASEWFELENEIWPAKRGK